MNLIFIILNSIFIIINSIKDDNFKDSEQMKYLEFPFDRNITINTSMSSRETFKSLFYNQIYIRIKVGSQQIEIPFYLYLQQYSFIIQSSEVSKDQVKGLYNENKSQTYKGSQQIESFIVMDMSEAFLSEDIFYFNKDKDKINLNFYLSKENHDNTHITEGGKIGFKFEPESSQSEEAFFITKLKYRKIISELVFTIKYDSIKDDDDKGKLIIGAPLHMIDNHIYNETFLVNDNAAKIYSKIEWALNFIQIKSGNNIIDTNCNAFLYIEIGYIIGSKNYFEYLLSLVSWKEYFSSNKCHETKFNIDDFERNDVSSKLGDVYTIYYCDKDVDVTKINIGELSFTNKEMVYSFNFSREELWSEKNGYKYFKIIKHDYYNEYWYLGKPFFKKYQMVFDYDNKKIGFYTKILNDNKSDDGSPSNNLIIYILVIVGLIIIIAGLVFIIVKNYKKFTKRKRANELMDDNYDYESKESNVVN